MPYAIFWEILFFMADFGHIHLFIKCKLFNQYVSSFYGARLWQLSSKLYQDLCTNAENT